MKCGTISPVPTSKDETATVQRFLCSSRRKCCDTYMFHWRSVLRKVVVGWLLILPVAGFAASGDEFYQRLYQRGMDHFAAGEYASAFTELRNAAFGFVEHVETFETTQAYAAIAAHRLGHDNDARDSLMRIVTAEKVQPHFRTVKLPDALRAEIDTLAAALLTAQESTLLGVPEQAQDAAAASKPAVETHAPTPKPNAVNADPTPHDADAKPTRPQQPALAPQPVTPAPQPVTPAPQPVAPSPQPQTPKPVVEAPQRQPQPQPAAPAPKSKTPAAQPSQSVDGKLAEAQRAAENGETGRARSIYNALLRDPSLAHEQALRLAEGLYRSRDFAGATQAFHLLDSFRQGEESFRYDYAVALYETGHYKDAKRELAASLAYIPVTPEVVRNRAKIEGAIE